MKDGSIGADEVVRRSAACERRIDNVHEDTMCIDA
jgi:hypothetical protein